MATGLNFQTQTIINSNLDPDSGKGVKLFKVEGTDVARIKRDFVFEKDNVVAIRKRAGYEPALCKATINFADATLLADLKSGGNKTYCRLDIYVGVEGAEPYIYSTPFTQKGMPLWVEFTVKSADTAKIIAENVAKIIKKNHLFVQDKEVVTATANADGTLVLEGATEFQRFRKIEISVFDEVQEYSDKVAELDKADEDATDITLNEWGKNGFGTYSQIVKDLRLPTAANYQWSHIRQVETPIVGAIYDQYIIEYAAPASNDGLHCVGQKLISKTSHVFWVKNDSELIYDWETVLSAVGTIVDEEGDTVTPTDPSTQSEEGEL